jgi:hypothetical protein
MNETKETLGQLERADQEGDWPVRRYHPENNEERVRKIYTLTEIQTMYLRNTIQTLYL